MSLYINSAKTIIFIPIWSKTKVTEKKKRCIVLRLASSRWMMDGEKGFSQRQKGWKTKMGMYRERCRGC